MASVLLLSVTQNMSTLMQKELCICQQVSQQMFLILLKFMFSSLKDASADSRVRDSFFLMSPVALLSLSLIKQSTVSRSVLLTAMHYSLK